MKRSSILTIIALVFLLAISSSAQAQNWQMIAGEIGSSSRWGSGWLDLAPVIDFMGGDKLRLSIGGTASKILIRLLPDTASPDDPVGIIGNYSIPTNRIVEVMLNEDHQKIKQISVHGGPKPWGIFSLGGGNGPASLLSVYQATR